MFNYFFASKLISRNWSCFQPGDSCINQYLLITLEIFRFLVMHQKFEVFSQTLKSFDSLAREGIIVKLKQIAISGELLDILSDFLNIRRQSVLLNSQNSPRTNVHVGVMQGSILDPLLLICVNDFLDNLTSNANVVPDDTSLFSVVHDVSTSAKELNDDLKKVNYQAFQQKMCFNPNPRKQAQEVIFNHKSKRPTHSLLVFNNNNVSQTFSQKQSSVILYFKLLSRSLQLCVS